MAKYKMFDFEKCGYGEAHKNWLAENSGKNLTAEGFVQEWQRVKKNGWNPKRSEKLYQNLKTKFGFFV